MMEKQLRVIIFDNLIEVSNKEATFGQNLSMPVAAPFSASNATGAICNMDTGIVAERAAAFGKRFKAAMTHADAAVAQA